MTNERMTTWEEACNHIATRGTLERVDNNARVKVAMEGTDIELSLAQHSVDGSTYLEVSTVVGESRFVSPSLMLVNNSELAVGTLALARNGAIVLRHLLDLDGALRDDLDVVLREVAAGALRAKAGIDRARER